MSEIALLSVAAGLAAAAGVWVVFRLCVFGGCRHTLRSPYFERPDEDSPADDVIALSRCVSCKRVLKAKPNYEFSVRV